MVHWWKYPIGINELEVRKTMSQMTMDSYDDVLTLKESIQKNSSEMLELPENQVQLERIRSLTNLIRSRGDCISLKTLALTGADLITMGMKPGKAIGDSLNILLEVVLEHPDWNEKEKLKEVLSSLESV